MIVLDEQLSDPQIIRSIEQWYKGKVIVIGESRPHTRITDNVNSGIATQVEGAHLRNDQLRRFLAKNSSQLRLLCYLLQADGQTLGRSPGGVAGDPQPTGVA